MKYVIGGIGDLLQTLDAAIFENKIAVFSHYLTAPEFYQPFGVKIKFERFFAAEDVIRLRYQLSPLEALSRSTFLQTINPIQVSSNEKERFGNWQKIVGIHPV